MITGSERVALEWVIAMLQPREGSPDRGETLTANAEGAEYRFVAEKILQGLLERLLTQK